MDRNSIFKCAVQGTNGKSPMARAQRALENAFTSPFIIPLYKPYNFIETAYNKVLSLTFVSTFANRLKYP